MTALTALWLPILLSAVFVFIASSIIHMAPLWHRGDYPALPNQDRILDALRPMAMSRAASNRPCLRDGSIPRQMDLRCR